MKKFFAAILTLLYVSTSTGATVYMHYCKNNLVGKGLGYHASKTCNKFKIEKTSQQGLDCCKNENKFFKSQTNEHATIAVRTLKHTVAVALPVSYVVIPSFDISTIVNENSVSPSPPETNSVAIYIRNCVFLL